MSTTTIPRWREMVQLWVWNSNSWENGHKQSPKEKALWVVDIDLIPIIIKSMVVDKIEEITYVQLFNQAIPRSNTWLWIWENDYIFNSPPTVKDLWSVGSK